MRYRTFTLESWIVPLWCIGAAIQYWVEPSRTHGIVLIIGAILLALVAIRSFCEIDDDGIVTYCEVAGLKYRFTRARWEDVRIYRVTDRSLVLETASGSIDFHGLPRGAMASAIERLDRHAASRGNA